VVEPDYTIDSSICGPFLFGMLQATDPLIESTMAALIDRLWCKTEVGGVARYEPRWEVSPAMRMTVISKSART